MYDSAGFELPGEQSTDFKAQVPGILEEVPLSRLAEHQITNHILPCREHHSAGWLVAGRHFVLRRSAWGQQSSQSRKTPLSNWVVSRALNLGWALKAGRFHLGQLRYSLYTYSLKCIPL